MIIAATTDTSTVVSSIMSSTCPPVALYRSTNKYMYATKLAKDAIGCVMVSIANTYGAYIRAHNVCRSLIRKRTSPAMMPTKNSNNTRLSHAYSGTSNTKGIKIIVNNNGNMVMYMTMHTKCSD